MKWDTIKEEGVVFTKPEFDDAYRILQLDALKDWIYDLQDLYNNILENRKEEYPNVTPNN